MSVLEGGVRSLIQRVEMEMQEPPEGRHTDRQTDRSMDLSITQLTNDDGEWVGSQGEDS